MASLETTHTYLEERILGSSKSSLLLSSQNLGDAGIQKITSALKDNKTITDLNLSRNGISDAGAEQISYILDSNGSIMRLNLQENDIGDQGIALISNSLIKHRLASLNLGFNYFGIRGATSLAHSLEATSSLTALYLTNSSIGEEGITKIAEAMKFNNSITILELQTNDFRSEGAKSLALMLENNKSLTRVDLSGNEIGDDGAAAIGCALARNQTLSSLLIAKMKHHLSPIINGLAQNRSITEVNMSFNKIGEGDHNLLMKLLEVNYKLAKINLGINSINDIGARAIARALPHNSSLTDLQLHSNMITDNGIEAFGEALVANKTLTSLNIERNPFGESVALLQTSLIERPYFMELKGVEYPPSLEKSKRLCISKANEIESQLMMNQELSQNASLKELIVGQELAVHEVERNLQLWAKKVLDKPLVFFFLGPSGVGKSEMAKAIAKVIHKEHWEKHFSQINLANFKSKESVAMFTGAMPGTVGFGKSGELVIALKKSSNGVVLLDEIDKAHPEALDILLHLFGDGHFYAYIEEEVEIIFDGRKEIEKQPQFRKIDGHNCIFVLTSNYGASVLTQKQDLIRSKPLDNKVTQTIINSIVDDLVHESPPKLRNEFLGRITSIIPFLPFTKGQLRTAVEKQLFQWGELLRTRYYQSFGWTEDVITVIYEAILTESNGIEKEQIPDDLNTKNFVNKFLVQLNAAQKEKIISIFEEQELDTVKELRQLSDSDWEKLAMPLGLMKKVKETLKKRPEGYEVFGMRLIKNYLTKLQYTYAATQTRDGDIIIITTYDKKFRMFKKANYYMASKKHAKELADNIDTIIIRRELEKKGLMEEVAKKKQFIGKKELLRNLNDEIGALKQTIDEIDAENDRLIRQKDLSDSSDDEIYFDALMCEPS